MLINQLRQDLKESMKNKETIRKNTLQIVIGNYQLAEKEKKSELTSEEGLAIIQKELKQTEEVLKDFKSAGRQDLINENEKIIEILKSYLPKQFNEEEIRSIVSEKIQELSLDTSNKGLLMKHLMPLFKNKANGKLVNQIIGEFVK